MRVCSSLKMSSRFARLFICRESYASLADPLRHDGSSRLASSLFICRALTKSLKSLTKFLNDSRSSLNMGRCWGVLFCMTAVFARFLISSSISRCSCSMIRLCLLKSLADLSEVPGALAVCCGVFSVLLFTHTCDPIRLFSSKFGSK